MEHNLHLHSNEMAGYYYMYLLREGYQWRSYDVFARVLNHALLSMLGSVKQVRLCNYLYMYITQFQQGGY